MRIDLRSARSLTLGCALAGLTILVCNSAAAQKPDAPSKALIEDANSYAERFDVNLDEAVRRLQIQSKVGVLEAALARDEQASFAGLWLEHEPTFRVVMSFTDSAAPQRWLPELDFLQGEIEVRTARWPLAELEKDQAAAIALANRLGYVVDADINVRENRVEIYVVEDRETSGLRNAQREFPASVVLIGVDRLAQPNQLDGGESRAPAPAASPFVRPAANGNLHRRSLWEHAVGPGPDTQLPQRGPARQSGRAVALGLRLARRQ